MYCFMFNLLFISLHLAVLGEWDIGLEELKQRTEKQGSLSNINF
jgi:hypothetical protein